MTAFPVSSFIRQTSLVQYSTQAPHPMHFFESYFSTAMMICSKPD